MILGVTFFDNMQVLRRGMCICAHERRKDVRYYLQQRCACATRISAPTCWSSGSCRGKDASSSSSVSTGGGRFGHDADGTDRSFFTGPLWLALDAVMTKIDPSTKNPIGCAGQREGSATRGLSSRSAPSTTGAVAVQLGLWSADAEEWTKSLLRQKAQVRSDPQATHLELKQEQARLAHTQLPKLRTEDHSSEGKEEKVDVDGKGGYERELQCFLKEVDMDLEVQHSNIGASRSATAVGIPPLLITVGRQVSDPSLHAGVVRNRTDVSHTESVHVCALSQSVVEVNYAVQALLRATRPRVQEGTPMTVSTIAQQRVLASSATPATALRYPHQLSFPLSLTEVKLQDHVKRRHSHLTTPTGASHTAERQNALSTVGSQGVQRGSGTAVLAELKSEAAVLAAALELLRVPHIASHVLVDLVSNPSTPLSSQDDANENVACAPESPRHIAAFRNEEACGSVVKPLRKLPSSELALLANSTGEAHPCTDSSSSLAGASLSLALHTLRVDDGVAVIRLPATFSSFQTAGVAHSSQSVKLRRTDRGHQWNPSMPLSSVSPFVLQLSNDPVVTCEELHTIADLKRRVHNVSRIHDQIARQPQPMSSNSGFCSVMTSQLPTSGSSPPRALPLFTACEEEALLAKELLKGGGAMALSPHLGSLLSAHGQSSSSPCPFSFSSGEGFLCTKGQRAAFLALHRELSNRFLRVQLFHVAVHARTTATATEMENGVPQKEKAAERGGSSLQEPATWARTHRWDHFFLCGCGGESQSHSPDVSALSSGVCAPSNGFKRGDSQTGDDVMTAATLQRHSGTFPGFRQKGQPRRRDWNPLDTPLQSYASRRKGRDGGYYYYYNMRNRSDSYPKRSHQGSSHASRGASTQSIRNKSPLGISASAFVYCMSSNGPEKCRELSNDDSDTQLLRTELQRLQYILNEPRRVRGYNGGGERCCHATSSITLRCSATSDTVEAASAGNVGKGGSRRSTRSPRSFSSTASSYFHSASAHAPFRAHLPRFLQAPVVKEKYTAQLAREAERTKQNQEKGAKLHEVAVEFVTNSEYSQSPEN